MVVGKNKFEESGLALLETAASMWVFLFFLIVSFELSRFAYHKAAMQYTLSTAMRQAVLGQVVFPLTELQTIKSRTRTIASTFGIKLKDSDIQVCAAAQYNTMSGNCISQNPGIAQQYMYLTAREAFTLALLRMPVTVSGHIAAMKEPT